MATAETSGHIILDVEMHSPPHAQPSGRGQGRNVKPIGSSSRSQTVKSSGASRPYGGTIGGKAFGNAPNIVISMQLKMTLPPLMLRALSICFLLATDQPLLILMKQL